MDQRASFPSPCSTRQHSKKNQEALTKCLPENRRGSSTTCMARSHQDRGARAHHRIHPPTHVRSGARPRPEDYFRRSAGQDLPRVLGRTMKAIPAFREPGARLEVMGELGLDYA